MDNNRQDRTTEIKPICKPLNANVKKQAESEQQLSSPSVRILLNSCYFLSHFWLNSLGERKAELS